MARTRQKSGGRDKRRATLYDAAWLRARLSSVPPPWRDLFRDAYIAARKVCVKSNAGESTESLFELVDRMCGEWSARTRPACAEGCSWCCQQDVLMAPFEFIAVRRAIEDNGLADSVRRKLREGDHGPVVEIDGRAMPVTACPLLDNDRCMIYSARPLACRTQFSMDAGQCRRACEAARAGDSGATYQRAGDPAITGIAVREAVQPTRRIFLRAALRDHLGDAGEALTES